MQIRVAGLALAGMLALALPACGQAAGTAHPPLLIASYSNHAAYIVAPDDQIVWQSDKMPGACQDAWLLPDNHVLLSGGNQVREVTADNQVIWQYEAPGNVPVEIHNCQPLPGGGTLIGEGGTCRLLELDQQGKPAKAIQLSLGGNAHTHMRQVRKTAKGTYLVTAAGENNIREYDAQGKELRVLLGKAVEKQGVKWPIVHSAELLPNGNLLIGGAYGAPVIEVDPADKIVWKLTADDIPEIGFVYSAGCLRLANGNTVVAAYTSKYPIFEVTPAKTVVWKFQNPALGNPTHVKLLAPAEVARFLKSKGK
ncbi:MAG: hypothetical protein NTW21_01635 [Verrucomicrobia bacterium]|nr:hypothetical protein [Verrucomicrobiota bacterium]